MGFKLSIGLGIALMLVSGAFKMYYDKSQAELDAFHIRLEQSIQNQKTLESTIDQQNDNLKETIKNQDLMIAQVERLQKQNMEAQNEVTDLRKKFSKHSLNVLSVRKPKLIEKIINTGTKEVLKDLEEITNPNQFDEVISVSSSAAG
jgi:predicted  nucleic acid-binding Zn-ribbon protein|tara:strand:- start:851 stop:1291 length:441 start_codon:yes stop_codon:yes gene_type:complete